MERKFEQNDVSLGSLIRSERKRAGITQARLGEMVGLKASRVSKIENGAPITPAVASFILERLGSRLQIRLADDNGSDDRDISYIMTVAYHFSRTKDIPLGSAYKYLETFNGVEFLLEYKDIEQTLPYREISDDLTRICHHNGGLIG